MFNGNPLPLHIRTHGTDRTGLVKSKIMNAPRGTIFPPVLQSEQEFVFSLQFCGRFAAASVLFFEGFLQDFESAAKGDSFYAEETFEWGIAYCQCLLDSFGDDEHGR